MECLWLCEEQTQKDMASLREEDMSKQKEEKAEKDRNRLSGEKVDSEGPSGEAPASFTFLSGC